MFTRRGVRSAGHPRAESPAYGAIVFEPAFNPALRTIQQGRAAKLLSRYDTKAWELAKLIPPGTSGPRAPSAKWDELGSVWEGTDKQGDQPEFDLTVFSGGPHTLPASAYPLRLSALYPATKPKAEWFVDWPASEFDEIGLWQPQLRTGVM